jgi:hypothetical protein
MCLIGLFWGQLSDENSTKKKKNRKEEALAGLHPRE